MLAGLALLLAAGVVALFVWTALPCPAPLDGVPFSVRVEDRKGNLLRLGLASDGRYRLRARLSALPPEAVSTVLLYEDRHFWHHPGVNPLSMARAALSMLTGGRVVGGSTITMQLVRLRLGLRTGSLKDKLRQTLWALRLERHWSKKDILEAYFSLAPYGGNVEGLEAAATVHFHKRASELSLSEVLALVPVPQNPAVRAPSVANARFFEAARRLQKAHMERLRKEGAGGDGAAHATALPLDGQALRVFDQDRLPFAAPHLTTEVLSARAAAEGSVPGPSRPERTDAGVQARPAQGHRPVDAEEKADHEPERTGDVPPAPSVFHFVPGHMRDRVRLTLHPRLQKLVEGALADFAARNAGFGLGNASALLVHWPSREVLALAGSADFFSVPISGQIDATDIRRSPGSTLKPFIYALALEQGIIHPRTLLLDMPRSFAGYDPGNFDGLYQGPLPADRALRLSRNVPAISLANRLDEPGLYGFLQRAGVRFSHSVDHYGLSLVLGGAEVTARELAALYCMLADGGVFRPLRFDLPDGEAVVPAPEGGGGSQRTPRRLLSPEAAYLVLRMLQSPEPDNAVRSREGKSVPLRFKTGTSNGLRDAWTCGVVGPYVLVVWVGNADNSPNPQLVGARTALPLFRTLSRALARLCGDDLPPFEDLHAGIPRGLNLTEVEVCSATGDTDTGLCPDPELRTKTLFIPGVSPVRESGILRRVRVNPETGLRACPGEKGEEQVMEFWPTELRALYARAGIHKPAPPGYGPACRDRSGDQGSPPRVVQPAEGLSYHARGAGSTCALALQAHADAGVGHLFWFDNDRYVGECEPGGVLILHAAPGAHVLRVVDENGRAATRRVEVGRVP